MTRDDIIRMAREAGFNTNHEMIWINNWEVSPYMQRFAALVAAAEREACAKMAEQTVCDTHLPTGIKIYGTKAAAAIRARGQA